MGFAAEDEWEEEVDIREQGAFTLARRCLTLFWTHGRLFASILVLVVFPLSIIQEALVAPLLIAHRSVVAADTRKWANGSLEVEPRLIASTAAIVLAIGLITCALSIVPNVCVTYSVAGIQSKTAVGLVDGLRAVRRLWRPVLLTSLCFTAVMFGAVVVAMPLMFASYFFQSVALFAAGTLLLCALLVYTGFVFQLGNVVPVLEGIYGWKALGKARRLLRGKKWVAFKIQLQLYLSVYLAEIATNGISQSIYSVMGITVDPVGTVDSHTILASAIQGVVHAALTSGLFLFIMIETLLYFSCKAFHQENVLDSDYFQNHVMQGAYIKVYQQSPYSDV